MTIPPEAVDAACKAYYADLYGDAEALADEHPDFIASMMQSSLAALTAAEPFIRAAVIEECARIVFDQHGEAPRSEYDNGGTQDGWQMACYKIAELIRALAKDP